jgi:hypothetical protein
MLPILLRLVGEREEISEAAEGNRLRLEPGPRARSQLQLGLDNKAGEAEARDRGGEQVGMQVRPALDPFPVTARRQALRGQSGRLPHTSLPLIFYKR